MKDKYILKIMTEKRLDELYENLTTDIICSVWAFIVFFCFIYFFCSLSYLSFLFCLFSVNCLFIFFIGFFGSLYSREKLYSSLKEEITIRLNFYYGKSTNQIEQT